MNRAEQIAKSVVNALPMYAGWGNLDSMQRRAAIEAVEHVLQQHPRLAAVPVEGKVSSRGIRADEKPEDGAA